MDKERPTLEFVPSIGGETYGRNRCNPRSRRN